MSLFLDTSIIVALYNSKDSNHEYAKQIFLQVSQGMYGHVYVSDYIIDEATTLMLIRTNNMSKSKDLLRYIVETKSFTILKVNQDTFQKTVNYYLGQNGTLSFTDCSTLMLMNENSIKNLATLDQEFKKQKQVNVL